MGQGPAFRRDPDGHIVELHCETEWCQAPPELKPALENQAQRFPARGVKPPGLGEKLISRAFFVQACPNRRLA